MQEFIADAAIVGYLLSVVWLIWSASGMRLAAFKDPLARRFSRKRTVLSAVVTGLAGATAVSFLPGQPRSIADVLTVWTILFLALTAGALLSGALMTLVFRSGLRRALKRAGQRDTEDV